MVIIMKEKFYRFMQGRYGSDELSKFLSTLGMVFVFISIFVKSGIIRFLFWFCLFWAYFRMFSKNHSARYAENQKFCNWRYDMAIKKNKKKQEWEQRKIYRLFRCPMCKQRVRVPKGRGKICITCPKCRQEFVRRS